MICHCTAFFRMAKGTKSAEDYGAVSSKTIMTLARFGKSILPKGFGQMEGAGTLPTNLENDKKMLKEHSLEFSSLNPDFRLANHPYLVNYPHPLGRACTLSSKPSFGSVEG